MTTAKKDPMITGFQSYIVNQTPYDFMNDPVTGLRPGETRPPHTMVKVDLRYGTGSVTLPPLKIWREGTWFDSLDEEEAKAADPTRMIPSNQAHDTWLVSGEGTPGNYLYRAYLIPLEVSRTGLDPGNVPKHPSQWKKALKQKPVTAPYSGYGFKPATPALPFGVRIRCTGCGHWFKPDDLKSHVECCPAANAGFSDWAIACECCHNLDLTSTVKDGYPRKPNMKEEDNGNSGVEVEADVRGATV